MSKVAVVWWSGTGNTHEMADAIQEGIEASGYAVDSIEAVDFNGDMLDQYVGFAFGCPSMGAEELESDEFEPMWESVIDGLGDRPVVLFGSYGWGDGEWIETWREDAEAAGVHVVDILAINETPDEDDKELCKNLGQKLMA